MEVEKAVKFVALVDKEVLCPKYNGSALNDRINKIIRKTRRETLTNVIIPSYDVKFLQSVIFSTSQVKRDESKDVLLAYVCIGTSAAPYYVPLYYFEHKPSNGIPRAFNLVDGELATNNPSKVIHV
ncbi:patatin-like protein 5 [Pyrus communis]|uniref:patatin-like protein 5 n=1 Tax=Pyrus communis TaxID=23211 RepID=UPI0035C136D1